MILNFLIKVCRFMESFFRMIKNGLYLLKK